MTCTLEVDLYPTGASVAVRDPRGARSYYHGAAIEVRDHTACAACGAPRGYAAPTLPPPADAAPLGRPRPMTTDLAVRPAETLTRFVPLEFTDAQRAMIRDTYANGCSDAEFAVLMEIAKARRLNPLMRQIHFISRWDGEKRRLVWSAQVAIDGLRAIAERTGLYHGQDKPEFVYAEDGTLESCEVRVYRKDWPRPSVGVAWWSEYVQTTRDKVTGQVRPSAMWAKMPRTMLAKVAESLALRRAFPEDMAALYGEDEIHGEASDGPRGEPRAGRRRRDRQRHGGGPAPEPAPRSLMMQVAATGDPAVVVAEPPPVVVEAPRAAVAALPPDPPAPDPADPVMPADFLAAVQALTLPGPAVALWLAHCDAIPAPLVESAKAILIEKVHAVGKLANARAWLQKGIAEELRARKRGGVAGTGGTP